MNECLAQLLKQILWWPRGHQLKSQSSTLIKGKGCVYMLPPSLYPNYQETLRTDVACHKEICNANTPFCMFLL